MSFKLSIPNLVCSEVCGIGWSLGFQKSECQFGVYCQVDLAIINQPWLKSTDI